VPSTVAVRCIETRIYLSEVIIMGRPKSPIAKRCATTQLNADIHDELSWLAQDLGVSVFALLRWGALIVLQRCNDGQVPASAAHLAERPLGGEKADPLFDRFKTVEVTFERDLLGRMDRLAQQHGLTARELIHEVVTKNVFSHLN
jgi:hypothetical protein